MHRDHLQHPRNPSKHHERKEWDHLAEERHEFDDDGRHDRSSWKAHRAFGARREEAGRQIRELRSRY